MPKSHRIRTQVGVDKSIKVNLEQDFDSINILSLKILQSDIYNRRCSDYGVVVGRVFANGGLGLPNARVSIFIPLDTEDENNPVITELYPYSSISDISEEGYRYNLLPKKPTYDGHVATGTFPDREEVLLDPSYIEVYDKYYKYTTKTNESGDYMIFGIPLGSQTIFMDIDLSDMGCFSLRPQDLIQAGIATESQVNGSKFKSSTNLNELPQIKTLNKIVDIAPLWGEPEVCQLGITRVDFDLTSEANVTIKPTAIFMGSIMSTTEDDALKVSCKPKVNTGNLCELVAGPGQILSIRQTIDTDELGYPILEQYELEQNGKVIDGDGSYLVNLPMNLDYIFTNEFGEQALSNDPKIGVPTRARYRFKFKWENEGGLQNEFLRANYLVPNVKEYGWSNSGYDDDPYKNGTVSVVSFTIPFNGFGSFTAISDGGLVFDNTTNVSNFTVSINGQPYFGDTQVITVNNGDLVEFFPILSDPNINGEINYKFFDLPFFQVLKSYSFSLDWDDYNEPESAINCEDTFYEFHYNKVYTTAMFIDRYKNGINRARHLGIKEIDNRSCKSTVNTFPVNDIIRNFDFLFFVFNILINILTFPLLVLLFVAHFIAWAWPVLKYLLIVLGIYLAYIAIREGIDSINSILEQAAFAVPGGPIFNIGVILRVIVQVLAILFKVGLAAAFIAFTVKYLIPIENFPRIGLPMLSYPDCSACDCQCGNADMSEANNLDSNSVNNQINEASQQATGGDLPSGVPSSASTSTSFLAPINDVSTFPLEHPNLSQLSGYDPLDQDGGIFGCSVSPHVHRSLTNSLAEEYIESNILVAATLNYQRSICGSESLDTGNFNNGIPDKKVLHAPTPFVFSALKSSAENWRYMAYPITETFSQKLNEFNYRKKFFDGVNKVKVKFNSNDPLNGGEHYDQVLVLLAKPGTLSQIGTGEIISFQDPKLSNCYINITGATFYNTNTGDTKNQFANYALTGTSLSGSAISIQVPYASSQNTSVFVNYNIINTGSTENYLKYPIDVEYFQVLTGYSYSDFISQANLSTLDRFPEKYLRHNHVINYRNGCSNNPWDVGSPTTYDQQLTNQNIIESIGGYGNYEILILARGVDPFTSKQYNRYDLSVIFGEPTTNGTVVIEGEYYLNIPIQGYPNGLKPKSHDIISNDDVGATNLYFESYNFTLSPEYTDINGNVRNQYTGFTSVLPYYYLCPDEPFSALYQPDINTASIISLSNTQQQSIINPLNRNYVLPSLPFVNLQNATQNYYFAGGSFTAGGFGFPNQNPIQFLYYKYFNEPNGQPLYCGPGSFPQYWVYSPAYYRYLTTANPPINPIQFNVSFTTPTTPQYLVMRSDRIPTSTNVQNGYYGETGYGLHQNNNFSYFKGGLQTTPQTGVAPDINGGQQYFDESDQVQTLTSTLTCEGLVSLRCYEGSGNNISVNTSCEVPSDRVVQGCYCLLNKKYITEYGEDAKLFLEWKTRFTLTFAACRGVFAQVFQNNWINGVLYMFTFNKSTTYDIDDPNTPVYNFCKDTTIFNPINNGFYYRSSPWNGTDFTGVASPPQTLSLSYPGYGYNTRRIQFPTTVMDLGPRDKFITEICNDNDFNGYLVDQVRSTSYKDNSDIIQMGFISRILNQSVINQMLPIANPTGGSSEGKGIIQFFNSTRKAERIDGDIAQALSINSEWKVTPYLNENYPDNYLFIGDDGQNGSNSRPVLGIFFSSSTEEYNYRKLLTPGVQFYSNACNGVFNYFGYPKDQIVPHYKWKITTSSNIFGSENNNWVTTSNQNQTGTGFFAKAYQDLDFDVPNQYFQTSTTSLGMITNFDLNDNPLTTPNIADNFVVGAPFFFYFGLNNGKTAMDKFIKLYVETED